MPDYIEGAEQVSKSFGLVYAKDGLSFRFALAQCSGCFLCCKSIMESFAATVDEKLRNRVLSVTKKVKKIKISSSGATSLRVQFREKKVIQLYEGFITYRNV